MLRQQIADMALKGRLAILKQRGIAPSEFPSHMLNEILDSIITDKLQPGEVIRCGRTRRYLVLADLSVTWQKLKAENNDQSESWIDLPIRADLMHHAKDLALAFKAANVMVDRGDYPKATTDS